MIFDLEKMEELFFFRFYGVEIDKEAIFEDNFDIGFFYNGVN